MPRIRAGTATEVSVTAGTTDVTLAATADALAVVGFSCQETTAGAASFVLRNGPDANGAPIAFVTLAAGESRAEFWGEDGLDASNGLFLDRVTGQTAVVVWLKGPR